VEAPTKEGKQASNSIISKDKNIFFDDFARQQASPIKGGGTFERESI
jgi:hypothetical protein